MRSGDYVVYSWTASDRLARTVTQQAHEFNALPGLPADAPAFGQPIRIVLAPNDRIFRAATGGRAPEWGAGVAAPDEGLIVLRAYGGTGGAYSELRSILRHELAHIALYRFLPDARVPRWFNEGYAMWAAGELDNDGTWMLRLAFATGKAPPLDSLELSWPAVAVDARIAYLLAASVVQYLVAESGTRGLEDFMRRWRASGDFDAALASTYGLSVDQLEIHWRRHVRRRYGWLAVITQSALVVTFVSIGVVALYLVRRRRDRAKLDRLRATELPDEPAYWSEPIDPDHEDPDIPRHG